MTCKHATDRPTDRLSNQPTDRPYVRIMWRCMLLMFRLLSFLLLYVFVGLLFFAYDCFFFCFCCYNFLWELNVSANLIQIINCLFICFVYIVYFCIMSRWMFAWHILFQGGGLEIFLCFLFLERSKFTSGTTNIIILVYFVFQHVRFLISLL